MDDIFTEIKEFIMVWNKYFTAIPVNEFEFTQYIKIINKLRNEVELDFAETLLFLELCELMADSIFTVEQCDAKYEMDYYKHTRTYDEAELNCCSRLINLLENYVHWEQQNAYDNSLIASHHK